VSDDKPVLLDAAQVAKIIGKTKNWVMTQARAGKIVYTKVGRHKRWTLEQVNEIIRSWEHKPQTVVVARVSSRRRAA
jgi:predicted site-specific integrase-resolvase